jgi:hypothetical protein
VTDGKSPGDRLLELVVFGPAGLAVTVVEEFPKFVEKGRHRVEGQVHTARLVGQVAFQMGRRQIEQSLGRIGSRSGVDTPERTSKDPPSGPVSSGRAVDSVEHRRPPYGATGHGVGNGSGSVSSLAIPGYDSLSASQVVQRLEGLSSAELEEVRVHEGAHRQRRTILHRVEQLLAGGDGAQP